MIRPDASSVAILLAYAKRGCVQMLHILIIREVTSVVGQLRRAVNVGYRTAAVMRMRSPDASCKSGCLEKAIKAQRSMGDTPSVGL